MLDRRILMLSLPVLFGLAACGEDEPVVADPEDLELEIVSGDGQVVRVADARPNASAALAAVQGTAPEGLLPEPFVARITIGGEAPWAAVVGPSFDVLPEGLSVTFRVIQPEDVPAAFGAFPCGEAVTDADIPDESGYVETFGDRGVWAGACTIEARLVVDSVPQAARTFHWIQTPGLAARGDLLAICSGSSTAISDTLDLAKRYGEDGLRDTHGNPIVWTLVPYAGSTLYTVRNDSKAIIAAAGVSGVDSVRVMGGGEFARTSHVYVRDPYFGSIITLFHWPADGDCGNFSKPDA